MLLWIIIPLIIYILLKYLNTPDPVNLAAVYSQRGKWYRLKFHIMRFVISRRQNRSKDRGHENLMSSQWGGDGGERDIVEMETKHRVEAPMAADAVFFDASNSDGWYFTLGTAQRSQNRMNLFFILRCPSLGTFVNEELYTNTNVQSIDTSKLEWQTASGFHVTCVLPMKKWRIHFNGKLVASPGLRNFERIGEEPAADNLIPIDASFDLEWTNFGTQFDFDTQCSPIAIAHSLAIEPWSRELFDKMRASHQTHYEQFGHLQGTFKMGNERMENIRMTSMRDHTITQYRRWADIRRYIMMIYHLEDGTCIHTSVISMPGVVFSHLEFGYIVTPSGITKPVDRVHFSLPNHGEDRLFPSEFHYSFQVGVEHFEADVSIKEVVSFKMGLDLACQVNEGMSEFVVNGKRGWGFVEVEYRIDPY